MKAAVINLGCKVNFYETEYFTQELVKMGFDIAENEDSPADAFIVNSCTVTAESDRKVMQTVRRIARENPSSFIAVTGCMAQVAPERIAKIPEVDAVIGNISKCKVLELLKDFRDGKTGKLNPPVIEAGDFTGPCVFEKMAISSTSRARATVKIEDGCNSACSYCLIHTARGPARSKPRKDALEEIKVLAANGYSEIVLTGIELLSYNDDLLKLAEEAAEIDGIKRIRLGSLDPFTIKPEWTDRICRNSKIAPHFHISLQSGSDRTLRNMRRKYTSETALSNIMYLKEKFPEANLFADIIVGFPGETDEDFRETVEFIKKVRFLHLHIFPFSPRKGTPAYTMADQIPQEIKKERARTLAGIQADIKLSILNRTVEAGKPVEVLFETDENGISHGHSDSFIEISAASDKELRGQILNVLPLSTDGDIIFGKII